MALIAAAVLLAGAGLMFAKNTVFGHKNAQPLASTNQASHHQASFKPDQPLAISTKNYKYDSQKKLATYTDNIGMISLAVSEQQTPAGKTPDATLLKNTANSLGTSQQMNTEGGVIFVVLNKDKKTQSAVFSSGKLVVTANLNSIIDGKFWQQFVTTFQPKSPV